MEPTEENVAWAIEKLSWFREWPGFPQSEESLVIRAKSFLKLVRNNQFNLATATSVIPNVNDVDWLLGEIYENHDRFPLPVEMREIYSAKFRPADEAGLEPVRSIESA